MIRRRVQVFGIRCGLVVSFEVGIGCCLQIFNNCNLEGSFSIDLFFEVYFLFCKWG